MQHQALGADFADVAPHATDRSYAARSAFDRRLDRERVHQGRSFLLSSDLKWIAKHPVRPYPTVTFHGVQLGRDAKLPLAFFRARDRPRFARAPDGTFEAHEPAFARLSWVELGGRSELEGGQRFLETRESGVYVRESDAVIPRLATETPWRTALGSRDDPSAAPRGRATPAGSRRSPSRACPTAGTAYVGFRRSSRRRR
jgi:hypothetical protein